MKNRRITYRIPEPCQEGWEKMSPVEKGRFCSSCAKPVVDFTTMSDQQIFRTMEDATGSVCGRMTISQVNREMNVGQTFQPTFSLHALVLGTALSTFSACQSHAQGEVVKVEQTEGTVKENMVEEPEIMGDVVAVRKEKISGKVMGHKQNSFIVGTSVTVYDEAGKELITTMTNDKGEFELILDYDLNPHRIFFRRDDYMERRFLVSELDTRRDMKVVLYRENEVIMGKVAAPEKR